MKLLRLTTEDKSGIFDSSLDQELVVEPKSQIALGSAALELNDKPLVISQKNNKVTYQVTAGFPHVARLTAGTYNSNNFQVFFNDFEDKLNAGLRVLATRAGGGDEISVPSEIGKQYKISKGAGQRVTIEANQSRAGPLRTDDIMRNTPKRQLNGDVLPQPVVLTLSPDSTSQLASGSKTAVDNDDYSRTTANTHAITKGCGIHRVRIKTLANVNDAADPQSGSGFTISLHKTSPLNYIDGRDMLLADMTCGIKCNSIIDAQGNQTGNYKAIVDGKIIEPDPAVSIAASGADTQKDVVSIEVTNGVVRGVVYKQQDGQVAPSVNLVFSVPYDHRTELFGSYSFHGGGLNDAGLYGCRINSVRWTADPFEEAADDTFDRGALGTDPHLLAASSPVTQRRAATNHSIAFEHSDVPYWLGFEPPTLPVIQGNTPIVFAGTNALKSNLENDCFLLEMLNLPIDSYDFIDTKKKRMNLLSVMPFVDNLGKCIYDPSHLIFLDLNNKDPLRLRDVRCRILRSDYSAVDLTGLSSLVIYIKHSGEVGA